MICVFTTVVPKYNGGVKDVTCGDRFPRGLVTSRDQLVCVETRVFQLNGAERPLYRGLGLTVIFCSYKFHNYSRSSSID